MQIIALPGIKNLAAHPSTFTHCGLAPRTRRELVSLKGSTGKGDQPGPRSLWQEQQTFLCNTGTGAQGFPARQITALI